jgi:hypothetical protein
MAFSISQGGAERDSAKVCRRRCNRISKNTTGNATCQEARACEQAASLAEQAASVALPEYQHFLIMLCVLPARE